MFIVVLFTKDRNRNNQMSTVVAYNFGFLFLFEGFPSEFLEEKMAYQGYQNSQNWPENTNFCFEPERMVNPIQTGKYKTCL